MYKKISSRTIFTHPRITLIEDDILLPNGESSTYLRFADQERCVAGCVVQQDDKILMTLDYSYPLDRETYLFPGGVGKISEEPLDVAKRELSEEVSLGGNLWIPLGQFCMDHRRYAMQLHAFLVRESYTMEGILDSEECITPVWLTESEIRELIQQGKIVDNTTLAIWALYQNFLTQKD